MKIVTLLPSATEIVCALGLGEQLAGVSHSCDFPPGVRRLPAMTSTPVPHSAGSEAIDAYVRDHLANSAALYDLDLAALARAAPDFIVSQALCDVCAVSTGDVLAALDALPSKPQIVDLEPHTLDDVLDDCLRVGRALGKPEAGRALVESLAARRAAVAARTRQIPVRERPRVAFLEWLLPPFNGGHWNPELVELAGGRDVLGAPGEPSSTLDWAVIERSEPDVLFIACCGFDKQRALGDLRQVLDSGTPGGAAAGRIVLADGNAYFSRPGPRLLDGLEMLAHALHPDRHPASPLGRCDTASPEAVRG